MKSLLLTHFSLQPTRHSCSDHMRGSVVRDESDKMSESAESSQCWRTEYIERFCPSASVTKSLPSDGDGDNFSIHSERSQISNSSSARGSNRSVREFVDSRGVTDKMFHSAPTAVRQLDSGDNSKSSSNVSSSSSGSISMRSVPGDQLSREESAHSTPVLSQCQEVDDRSIADSSYDYISDQISVAEESQLPERLSSSMSGPLPVRVNSRFSTEYKDNFKQWEPLESREEARENKVVVERPRPASAERTKRESTGSNKLKGRSETQAKYSWPDESWYHQSMPKEKRPEKPRSMSTGRLGMTRGHYQKTWWNENQEKRSEGPSSTQKSGFSSDSLERGSGCLVAESPERIRISPPLNESAPAVRSPDSVSNVSSPPKQRKSESPRIFHKSSHLLPKKEVRPSMKDHFGSTTEARGTWCSQVTSVARKKGPYQV